MEKWQRKVFSLSLFLIRFSNKNKQKRSQQNGDYTKILKSGHLGITSNYSSLKSIDLCKICSIIPIYATLLIISNLLNNRFHQYNMKSYDATNSTWNFSKNQRNHVIIDPYLEIVKKGYICKMLSDYFEEIQVCDKLRQCLIEQGQTFCTFNQTQRKEFLFKLFQLLVIGGSFNQYEDMIEPYLSWTKKLYKSLVSVRKRSQTGQIFIESMFYQIKSLDGGKCYKKGHNPQNILYIIINPSIRVVHVISNEWRKFW